MKRLFSAGLALALLSANTVIAQNNNSYVDDVYYTGSQAQQDAKKEAKKQKKQQQEEAEYYNSSEYDNDYAAQDQNDTYIDYDDDSYASRMNRFYYPMAGVGYWGSMYRPFWNDPFMANPYYGWGGWYTPGFSVNMGWGGGPYWTNSWGMNTWYGYGGFYPSYGWGGMGFGYQAGFWNGYYAGLYNHNHYNPYRPVNYGPRGNRNGNIGSTGSYGRNSGIMPAQRGNRNPEMGAINRNSGIERNNTGRAGIGVAERRDNSLQNNQQRGVSPRQNNSNPVIRLDEGSTSGRSGVQGNRSINNVNRNTTIIQQDGQRRSNNGLFNRSNSAERINSQPARNYNVERSQPTRNYSQPSAPARNYSSPAPSRSSGGSFGGGSGGRSGGGGGRR